MKIAVGESSCAALTTDGTLYVWLIDKKYAALSYFTIDYLKMSISLKRGFFLTINNISSKSSMKAIQAIT